MTVVIAPSATILWRARNDRGFALMGVVALLILLGLFTAVITSLVASSSGSFANLTQGTQAFAIAHGGAEWYREQLGADTNWSDQTTQTMTFAQGSFTINSFTYDSVLDRLTFTSTGSIPQNLADMTIKRWQKWTVERTYAPPFNYALFQGMDTGNALVFTDRGIAGTSVSVSGGDMWYPGNVQIIPINQVDYYIQLAVLPQAATVTGVGTYTVKNISPAYPTMPTINTSVYTDQMASFDTALNTNTSTTDKIVENTTFNINSPIPPDPNCSGGVCKYRNFTTRGSVTIVGAGTISANQTIRLHGEDNLAVSSLAISPTSPNTIDFIANQSVVIGSNNDNPIISSSPNVKFYSRAQTSTAQLVHIRGDNTTLGTSTGAGVKIYARRRILVETGANINTKSELFVDQQAVDSTNNLIDIVGGLGKTTVVGGENALVSMSLNNPAIRLRNLGTDRLQTQVTGVVYANGSSTTGYCEINDATVNGSVVCNRFTGNQIANTSFTYSDTLYRPNPPQPAFKIHVARVRDSWDGV